MNELIQKLMECLKKEAAHYRQMMALAVRQKELLVSGEVESLPANVRLEEKEVFALSPLVSERNELLGKMAKIYRMKTMTLTDALQRAPVEMAEEFKTTVVELVRSAKALEEVNQGNEKLLNNSLSYVNFTLRAIAGGDKKKTYTPTATTEEKKSSFVNRVV